MGADLEIEVLLIDLHEFLDDAPVIFDFLLVLLEFNDQFVVVELFNHTFWPIASHCTRVIGLKEGVPEGFLSLRVFVENEQK